MCRNVWCYEVENALQLEVGRVPGDYPFSAGYCITRTQLGITLKYGRIWGICHNFCDWTIPHRVKRKVGICLATIFDARHCGVTRDWQLPSWCFAGQGRWQSTVERFNQSSDMAYSDVHVDRWSDYAFSCRWPTETLQCNWANYTLHSRSTHCVLLIKVLEQDTVDVYWPLRCCWSVSSLCVYVAGDWWGVWEASTAKCSWGREPRYTQLPLRHSRLYRMVYLWRRRQHILLLCLSAFQLSDVPCYSRWSELSGIPARTACQEVQRPRRHAGQLDTRGTTDCSCQCGFE